MSLILHNSAMLLTFQILLILLGLHVLLSLVTSLRGSLNMADAASAITKPVLFDILPLIVLALIAAADPTGWLVIGAWFIAAVLIAIRSLIQLLADIKALIG